MFMSLWLSAAGDGLPSLWQQLWEQHWWSRVDFSAMSVMHILSSRRIMLSLCLRSGSGCKWDVQQMEVFNGLRVIQTIFSLASKKKPRTVAWPLRRVQEHPVHGLETGRNPLTVPVEKKGLVLSKRSIPCTLPAVGARWLHSIHSCQEKCHISSWIADAKFDAFVYSMLFVLYFVLHQTDTNRRRRIWDTDNILTAESHCLINCNHCHCAFHSLHPIY